AAVGVAAHRFTAQVAATVARPRHVRPVAAGEDGRFLHAYPLRFLPLDRETGRRCRLLGIRTLGDLAALPPAAVRTQFGAEMARLQRWAQGRDETPIQPLRPEQAETIAYCFDEPLTTREPLDRLLDEAARALAARLQAAARQAGRLSLLLETESGAHTLRQTFRQPTWTAGHLAETLRQLVAAHAFDAGLVAFRVSLAGLVPVATQQLALFAPPADLRQAFAGARRVAAKYPSSRFYQAALADPHPLPERRFRLHPLPHDAAVA
ncbi:MAG: hypothetical protein KC425_21095, partial [Anaerolineales bacterium]|nr:hypothetical protein [Anaerolineales bacterium]